MKRSESINELAAALSKAQRDLRGVEKNKTNPGFKSRYADLQSFLEACREPLATNGLAVSQGTACVDGEVHLITLLMHASGQWIESAYPLRPVKNDPQGYGSAYTYGRRYSLSAMVGLAPEDDDGNAASGDGHPGAQRPRHDDRRPHRDDRAPSRQDVNREFANGRNPGHPPAETWHDFIGGWLRRTNRLWVLEMTKEGVPPDRRKEWAELSNEPRVVNYLVSRLLELDQIETADVGKEGNPTVRDPDKSRKVVEDFFARKPQSIQKAVAKYLDGKRSEARAKLGMPDPEAEDSPTPPEKVPGRGDAYEQPEPSSN